MPMVGVEKWSGLIDDGVAYLRQFERIVIHSRCPHAIEDARLWAFKTDRSTGDVLPDLEDGNDNVFDACWHALMPLIKGGGTWNFIVA
jgi:phage terminase large subunit